MTSDMYVQLTGPKLHENTMDTKKIIATPALDMAGFDSRSREPRTASMMRSTVIVMVPKMRGPFRPTLSMRKKMKIKSTLRLVSAQTKETLTLYLLAIGPTKL